MGDATYQRNIFQRLMGMCATKTPQDAGCWTAGDGKIVLDLARAPELAESNGALRLEGKGSPERVLVIKGDDGEFHAFRNRCTHAGRRLDPVPGTGQVQCCSVGKSTFDYAGKRISGSAKKDAIPLPVAADGGKLVITLPVK